MFDFYHMFHTVIFNFQPFVSFSSSCNEFRNPLFCTIPWLLFLNLSPIAFQKILMDCLDKFGFVRSSSVIRGFHQNVCPRNISDVTCQDLLYWTRNISNLRISDQKKTKGKQNITDISGNSEQSRINIALSELTHCFSERTWCLTFMGKWTN